MNQPKPPFKKPSPDGSSEPSRPTLPWRRVWWLILLSLLAWNAWTLLQPSEPQVELPYSEFIAQVNADNISEVTIAGGDIDGTFGTAVIWPPTGTATAIPATPTLGAALAGSTSSQSYKSFHVLFPETIGDPGLIPLLQEHGVKINVTPPNVSWISILLTYGLPVLLLGGLALYMVRSSRNQAGGILGFGRTRARVQEGQKSTVTFGDVAGADEAKSELMEVVDFLRNPKKYHEIGARIPRGVLLVGAPGTGKTLMARAVAGEAGVPFFNISASEFVEMFVGVGASRVRDLFTQAKAAAPDIVFIDELDAVGRRRGAGLGATNDEREQTLNQLLVEMDGFDEHHEVIILAATNRPDVLDPALLRPGRFDRQVTVGMPDRAGREAILQIHTREILLGPDIDLGVLSRTTTGLSGAELANLCNEAALVAARYDHKRVEMPHFEEALDRIILGGVQPLLVDKHERAVVAYHELGHTLVAWLSPEAEPVHKVSIVPRGRSLGVTEQLPNDDRRNYSRAYLIARLAIMLGGRVSEEIVFGDITTGAENDLVEATRLARRMVTRWGMGSLGPVAFKADEEQPFLGYELSQGRDYGQETADHIDRDVQGLLAERREFVLQLLTSERAKLDTLAQTLLHDETVDNDGLIKALGPRSITETE